MSHTVFDYPNLIAAIEDSAALTDAGYAFVKREGGEQFFSFAQLREEARNRAAHLRALGMKKGDRLAMVLPDGEDFVPTFLGAVYAGIIPVPLYPPLSLGRLDSYIDGLVAIMGKAEPTFIVSNAKLKQVLWSAAARVPSLKGFVTSEELTRPAPQEASRAPAEVSGEDIAFLQFTSGSTSLPKGVEVTHQSLRANAWAIMRDGLQTNHAVDHGVSWLPLYHDMGLIGFVISPMFHRVPCTFIPTMSFVRNATIWLDTISRKKGTISFAPNFAYALTVKRAKPEQIAKLDLSSMRAFGCGAEPINATTMRAFASTFAPSGLKPTALVPCYGMAEATLAISFIALDEEVSTDVVDRELYQTRGLAEPVHVSKLESNEANAYVCCGRAFPGHDVGAFDEKGRRLTDRRVGELWVRGPSIAAGYFKDPEATAKTFGGGWLRTGDLGYLVEGRVYITGRKKDLIIINGRNYDPSAIEWQLEEVPGVRKGSVVAFSRPGAGSEELIIALESRSETPDALKEAVRQRLTEQLQLTAADVAIVGPGELPKTSSGKLQRSKARAQYLDGTLGVEGARTLGGNAQKVTLAKHVALSLLGRGRHRARRVVEHTAEIRSLTDAVGKLRLAGSYTRGLVGRFF